MQTDPAYTTQTTATLLNWLVHYAETCGQTRLLLGTLPPGVVRTAVVQASREAETRLQAIRREIDRRVSVQDADQ